MMTSVSVVASCEVVHYHITQKGDDANGGKKTVK
jgi:hypothetical protein